MLSRLLPVPPFLILAAAAAWLHLRYEDLPARIPTHWGASGAPDRWTDKSPAVVFSILAIGFALLLLLNGILWFGRKPVTAQGVRQRRILTALPYHLAAVFSAIALAPLFSPGGRMPWMLPLVLGGLVLCLAVAALPVRGNYAPTPPGWKWGIYYNPDNPDIWIDDPDGIGGTFNLAQPFSWAILGAILALPVLLYALTKRQ
jgi:hypothetical protein